jgi:hypothetical protein
MKRASTILHPKQSLVGGGGRREKRVRTLQLEDLLIKNVSYTSSTIKIISRMAVLEKTLETKKFDKIFFETFFIFKKYLQLGLILCQPRKALFIHKP